MWLRGAGEASPSAGLRLLPAGAAWDVESARAARRLRWEASEDGSRAEGATKATAPSRSTLSWSSLNWSLSEVDFREVYYSYAGGFDACFVGSEAPAWLEAFVASPRRVASAAPALWCGANSFVHLDPGSVDELLPAWIEALSGREGARITVVVPRSASPEDGGRVERLRSAGFETLRDLGGRACSMLDGSPARPPSDVVVMCAGRRRARRPKLIMDRERCLAGMDPLDSGLGTKEPKDAKLERAWEPIPLSPEKWVGKGLPEEVVRMMTDGVDVEGPLRPSFYEIPQYPFQDAEHAMKGGEEADRALAVGAMEYVPAALVSELMRDCVVHPWLVVHQSEDKWRACQDYKNGTNLFNDSPPFNLPSV